MSDAEGWQSIRMQRGFAPFAPVSEQVGKLMRYELHLVVPQSEGEEINPDDVRVVTPRQYVELNDVRVDAAPRINEKLSDYTESEFLELLQKIETCDFNTEEEDSQAVAEFVAMAEHPEGTDLLFYPDPSKGPHSAAAVLAEIKAWRAANGKPGFKDSSQ